MLMKIFITIEVLFGVSFIFFLIKYIILTFKLLDYLHKKHHNEWVELTTVFGMGPGMWNSLAIFDFVFNKEKLNDPSVKQLKAKVRYSIYSLIATMILGVIVAAPFVLLMLLFYDK